MAPASELGERGWPLSARCKQTRAFWARQDGEGERLLYEFAPVAVPLSAFAAAGPNNKQYGTVTPLILDLSQSGNIPLPRGILAVRYFFDLDGAGEETVDTVGSEHATF